MYHKNKKIAEMENIPYFLPVMYVLKTNVYGRMWLVHSNVRPWRIKTLFARPVYI